MVAQQVLVLFVVVRIRLGQQKGDIPSGMSPFLLSDYLPFIKVEPYWLRASAKAAPALNLATFLAAMVIFSFVWRLIPSRAGRSFTLNVPKPMSCTLSPSTSAFLIASRVASKAFFAFV